MANMRYSEIPRDVSCDSLRINQENVDQCWNNMPSNQIFYAFSGSPESLVNSSLVFSNFSSLPRSSNITHNAPMQTLMLLEIFPEALANQLTLLDLTSFRAIEPEELTSCAWSKKNKLEVAPNIVGFTRRFNHVSFWTVQEVLNGNTPKTRAEIIAHFIKVCKKLYDLNNLHSLFAIISALQSASVYRLAKTWSSISKKDKTTFDKLADIFSDKENWRNLRTHMESLKLPCIPYLGLFLTDLVYIDMAHPHSGGLESEQRKLKMNNTLRIIANYQQSSYSNLTRSCEVQEYLGNIRYIEELQKFVEDDQYKLSLKLEPPSPVASSSSSKESVSEPVTHGRGSAVSLNLSPARCSGSLRLQSAPSAKFVPGHRKARSLGTKFRSTSLPRNFHKQEAGVFRACHMANSPDPSDLMRKSMVETTRHLLDDSVLEEHSDVIKEETSRTSDTEDERGQLLYCRSMDCEDLSEDVVTIQGCLRRKTQEKYGKKPAVSSWQRYWVQLWGTKLVYYPPKSFKGFDRGDFKREPCKITCVLGWMLTIADQQPDFYLRDPVKKSMYKFRAMSKMDVLSWCRHLQSAIRGGRGKPLPVNLMSFE